MNYILVIAAIYTYIQVGILVGRQVARSDAYAAEATGAGVFWPVVAAMFLVFWAFAGPWVLAEKIRNK